MKILPIILGFIFCYGVRAQELRYSDEEVINSYHYLLARLFVLKQEREDFKQNGYRWNKLVHENNPKNKLGVSSAWIGLDKKSCTFLDIPDLKDRYFSIQAFNGWGETIHRANQKNYSERISFCLPQTKLVSKVPSTRVDTPFNKIFLKIIIEQEGTENFKNIQKLFKLSTSGKPKMNGPHSLGRFSRKKLPGIEAFQGVNSILRQGEDENQDMTAIRETLFKISEIAKDPSEQKPIDLIIQKWAIPSFLKKLETSYNEVSWHQHGQYPSLSPYLVRSMNNYKDLWLNSEEQINFSTTKDSEGNPLSPDEIYTMTIDAKGLQYAEVWSLGVSHSRSGVDHSMSLGHNLDGSLTLYFSSYKPLGIRTANWISLKNKKEIELHFKMFGRDVNLTQREKFPPDLIKARHRIGTTMNEKKFR